MSLRWEWSGFVASLGVCLTTLLTVTQPAEAHLDIQTRLADVNRRIDAEPENAALYLRRAQLYRVHRQWREAIVDLVRAPFGETASQRRRGWQPSRKIGRESCSAESRLLVSRPEWPA